MKMAPLNFNYHSMTLARLRLFYHFLMTTLLYRMGSISMGKNVIICNPLLVSNRNVKFGTRIFIRDFARIEAVTRNFNNTYNPVIELHDGISIEQNLHLTCAESISIGRNTAIAANVTITDIIHPYEDINLASDWQPIKISKVIIGENCKIYNNAVILPGTHLGKHCIIGANSVVRGLVYKDYSVIVGIPAKVVRRYCLVKKIWRNTDNKGEFKD